MHLCSRQVAGGGGSLQQKRKCSAARGERSLLTQQLHPTCSQPLKARLTRRQLTQRRPAGRPRLPEQRAGCLTCTKTLLKTPGTVPHSQEVRLATIAEHPRALAPLRFLLMAVTYYSVVPPHDSVCKSSKGAFACPRYQDMYQKAAACGMTCFELALHLIVVSRTPSSVSKQNLHNETSSKIKTS